MTLPLTILLGASSATVLPIAVSSSASVALPSASVVSRESSSSDIENFLIRFLPCIKRKRVGGKGRKRNDDEGNPGRPVGPPASRGDHSPTGRNVRSMVRRQRGSRPAIGRFGWFGAPRCR